MSRLQPVLWLKGTFLTPQHLQVQDRFIESLLQFRVEAQNFRPWGFTALGVDQEVLESGTLALTRASGILPDGLAFDLPESDPAPPPRPFADFFDPERKHLDLYLVVPPHRERGLNVTIQSASADTRYRGEIISVRDENAATTEKPVLVARKNLRLLTGVESREGLTAMRVARVRRTEANAFELDPHFVPPLLSTAASPYLTSIARRLVEILSSKSSELASTRRQKNQSLADFTASDVASFWLLYTVNTYLPHFRHLFETKRGHPEELYGVMLSLAGALTTFSREISSDSFLSYNHDELEVCFTDLDEKLRLLLEAVVPKNFVALPLKEVRNHIYATAVDDDKYLVNTKMYLAVSAETKEVAVIQKAPALIKVCSADHIDHLVRQALPGVQLTHVPAPPSSIPVKLNYQYFSLNQSGGAWEAVGRARNLAAYVPGDFPNPKLELVILFPQGR
ncbi:MAG: type VI secretion system baseplate subunit TssK [Bryobacterales bacterium]